MCFGVRAALVILVLAAAAMSTRVVSFAAFTVGGAPTVKITRTLTGSCYSESLAADRDDAYRCISGNDHSKIAIQEDQIFLPTEPNAAGLTGAPTPAEQISAMRQQLDDKSARGTLDADGYKAALLRLSNLEQLLAEGEISDDQLTELLKVDAGVTATSIFPTADALKQVVLKADGAITLSGAGSGSTIHTATSAADEIAKLAELKTKGLLTDAEFAAEKEKLLGI
jgi:hypothetical protein